MGKVDLRKLTCVNVEITENGKIVPKKIISIKYEDCYRFLS